MNLHKIPDTTLSPETEAEIDRWVREDKLQRAIRRMGGNKPSSGWRHDEADYHEDHEDGGHH